MPRQPVAFVISMRNSRESCRWRCLWGECFPWISCSVGQFSGKSTEKHLNWNSKRHSPLYKQSPWMQFTQRISLMIIKAQYARLTFSPQLLRLDPFVRYPVCRFATDTETWQSIEWHLLSKLRSMLLVNTLKVKSKIMTEKQTRKIAISFHLINQWQCPAQNRISLCFDRSVTMPGPK